MGSEENGYPHMMEITWDDIEHHYRINYISDELNNDMLEELAHYGLSDIKSLKNAPVEVFDFYPRALLVEAKTISRELNWSTVIANPTIKGMSLEDLKRPIAKEHLRLLERATRELNLPDLRSTNRRKLTILRHYRDWFNTLTARQILHLQDYLEGYDDVLTRPVENWYSTEFFEVIQRTLLDVFTRKIRYLSASRISPTMLFTLETRMDWSEVGVDGRSVAAALKEHGDRKITYWDPHQARILDTDLMSAVLSWIKFFDLLDRVEAEDRGKLGTLLKVYSPGMAKELDLTAVGFGISQILPIIVQGLLTPPGCIFIVEQPEVHLHPHVQSQLAYFFFALTRIHVQCVVETHSEYIINQLRLLIVKRQDLMHDQVKIYFAERSSETGTQFEEVRLNNEGNIINWPRGFMDEGTKLAQEMLKVVTESI